MKKILLLVGCILSMFSCSKKESFNDKVLIAVTPYVESQTGIDLKTKNNTLNIISVDTLTEKDRLKIKANELYDYFNIEHFPLLEIQKDEVEGFTNIYNRYHTENAKSKLENSIKEYERLKDNAMPYLKQMESIEATYKTADSIKFKAYKVIALLNFITKDNTAKMDTLKIIMNDNFNVIEKKDFIKN